MTLYHNLQEIVKSGLEGGDGGLEALYLGEGIGFLLALVGHDLLRGAGDKPFIGELLAD